MNEGVSNIGLILNEFERCRLLDIGVENIGV
jgi:hypothetical protein